MQITMVGDAITNVLGWTGDVITALTAESGELAALGPFFMITVGVSAVMLGIKVVRGFVWGA